MFFKGLTNISPTYPYFCEYQPQVPRSMGCNPSDEELQEMIAEMDEDNSGTVDFEEFVILMKKKSADDELEDDIEEAFKVFDTNNDG